MGYNIYESSPAPLAIVNVCKKYVNWESAEDDLATTYAHHSSLSFELRSLIGNDELKTPNKLSFMEADERIMLVRAGVPLL